MAKPRLIALGASNLTRFLPKLLQVAIAEAGAPVDAFAALGMGRSYGLRTRLLWRQLPGIQDCGIWPGLAESSTPSSSPDVVEQASQQADATGFVTDVGNDVFYGVEPLQVLDWVDGALQRLRPMVARLVVTGVPESVFDLGRARFEVMRRILVPSCQLELQDGKRRAAALHDGLRQLAEQHGAEFLQFPKHWYGWDAIHVKRRYWRSLCERLLGVERRDSLPRVANLQVRLAAPELRWLFQRERHTKQPAVVLGDGTSISLY